MLSVPFVPMHGTSARTRSYLPSSVRAVASARRYSTRSTSGARRLRRCVRRASLVSNATIRAPGFRSARMSVFPPGAACYRESPVAPRALATPAKKKPSIQKSHSSLLKRLRGRYIPGNRGVCGSQDLAGCKLNSHFDEFPFCIRARNANHRSRLLLSVATDRARRVEAVEVRPPADHPLGMRLRQMRVQLATRSGRPMALDCQQACCNTDSTMRYMQNHGWPVL